MNQNNDGIDDGTAATRARINATRSELASTLEAIERKLDVPSHVRRWSRNAQDSYRRNPVPWIAGATAVGIVVIGAVVWALVTDDD